MKKFTILKEQLQNLKKKVKKFERKEAEYKAEISELKGNLKNSNNEVQDLKRKVKEYEFKLTMTPDNEYKKYLPGLKEMPQKNIFSQARPVGNDDIWKINDEMQDNLKDLDDITGSRELWINNLENKIKANSFKSPTKLFPIEKAHKFNSAREFGNKRKTPEPPKMANRKYVY
jgi:chromosome segregation ATPase